MRTALVVILAILFSGMLAAQDTENLAGNVGDSEQDYFLFNIDFAGGQTINITLTIAATGGMSGLAADLIDLDEMCTNGSATGVESDFDAGTGTITLTMSPNLAGMHEFVVAIETDSSNGPSPYSGTLSIDAGTMTLTGSSTYGVVFGVQQTLMARAQRFVFNPGGAATTTQDFVINVGSTPRTVTFYIQAILVSGTGCTTTVYEIDGAGAEQLLTTLTNDDEANPTTSMRSGQVRLRVRLAAGSGGAFVWTASMPTGVAVVGAYTSGGGGGGKKDNGGCSASGGSAALPVALALLCIAARRRRFA